MIDDTATGIWADNFPSSCLRIRLHVLIMIVHLRSGDSSFSHDLANITPCIGSGRRQMFQCDTGFVVYRREYASLGERICVRQGKPLFSLDSWNAHKYFTHGRPRLFLGCSKTTKASLVCPRYPIQNGNCLILSMAQMP